MGELVSMNYNDHFTQLLQANGPAVIEPSLPSINAAKALDYMDGHQAYHMERVFASAQHEERR